MKLWGYVISTDSEHSDRVRLEREDERAITAYAAGAKPRTKLVGVVQERLVTASVPFLRRPQALELLSLVPPGGGIVVPRLDAFGSAMDCDRTIRACREKGVRLFIPKIGDITTNRVARAVVAGFAELERARRRERTLTGQASRRASAQRVSGTVPFGYVLQDGYLAEQPDQQRAITRMRELRQQGQSFRAIVATIAKEFDTSPSAFGIQRIVDNKRKLDESAIRRRAVPEQPTETPRKRFNVIPEEP